jgi:hypothetical protein
MKLRATLCALALAALAPRPVRPHETLTTTVLFDREIVRILDRHCVACHAEGGVSFPLETYEQTWLRKREIRSAVIARHMPPWSAFPGYGQFANDNSLTLRETQFLVSWVEGLGPRNAGTVFTNVADPNAKPRAEVRAHADFGHWSLGEPDARLALPPQTIAPGPGDSIRRLVLDPRLSGARRLRAVEFVPGDRRVVRAAFFTVQETGQWIGSWTPWHSHQSLPSGAAIRIPAGAHIAAEIHYGAASAPVRAQGTLGLYFAESPAAGTVSDLLLEARADSPRARAAARLNNGAAILALWPDLPPGLQSLEVSARTPDGGTQVLLFARDIPREWPTPYVFKEPVRLPRGTELFAVAYSDRAASSVKVVAQVLAQ